MAHNPELAPAPACALEGCDVPVLRQAGKKKGGRPRLYCSDAHRSEARRRRLGSAAGRPGATAPYASTGAGAEGEPPLDRVRRLLADLVAAVDVAALEAHEAQADRRDDTLVAVIRAEATAEVLRSQQAAADAARQAAAAEKRLAGERGEWQETVRRLVEERSEREQLIEELTGALDGARTELEREILAHHTDLERAESLLQAQRAAHESQAIESAAELDELRTRLGAALLNAEEAGRRAARADEQLADASAAVVQLEVRAARAEEQARQVADRLDEAKAQAERLRRELADERRHRHSLETALFQGIAPSATAATVKARRASEGRRATQGGVRAAESKDAAGSPRS